MSAATTTRTTARQLTSEVVVEREKREYRQCPYCGWPCRGRACGSHRDLVQLEHDLFTPHNNDPAPTHLADAGTGSPTEGV